MTRRAPRTNRRQKIARQRGRWDVFFRFLKSVRLVTDRERHRTRINGEPVDRNPWPFCHAGEHRVPELCPQTGACAGHCPNHPHDDDEATDD
jgi:hypothetical protein